MLDLSKIKREIEVEKETFVLSEDSAESLDLDEVRKELAGVGLELFQGMCGHWLARKRDPLQDLPERARACFCGGQFNSYSALQQVPFDVGRTLAAAAIEHVITGNNDLALAVFTRQGLGDDAVEALQAYLRNGK